MPSGVPTPSPSTFVGLLQIKRFRWLGRLARRAVEKASVGNNKEELGLTCCAATGIARKSGVAHEIATSSSRTFVRAFASSRNIMPFWLVERCLTW